MTPKELDDRIELNVRRYFDHYLSEVLPATVSAVVKAHDEAEDSHGGIRRLRSYVMGGLVGVGAAAGVGLEKLIGLMF